MRKIVARVAIVVAFLAVLALVPASKPSTAEAHPLGNFSVSRYARIELGRETVKLRYVIDMAEIPAFTEFKAIDSNGDGNVSEAESSAYRARRAPDLLDHLTLAVDGKRVALTAKTSALTFPEGQGGLSTLRLVVDAAAAVEPSWLGGASATFKDDNYADRIVGWKEIVVTTGDGIALNDSSVARVDQTAELTAYPEARLQSPLDVRDASFRFAASVPGTSAEIQQTVASTATTSKVNGRVPDRFASLISREKLTPAFVAVSLLAAMFWGAAHALGPGHGKTIVAAYLVGTRSTARHALILGLAVTATHTSTVFALGLFTLYASRFLPAEVLYVWLSVVSGLLVLLMGAYLFTTRLRQIDGSGFSRQVHAHDGIEHTHEAAAENAAPSRVFRPYSRRQDRASGIAAGHVHSHGGSTHSHLPKQEGFKGLLLLGISGGLLPCPTALVVMLAAIALDRVAYGLVLVVAFSFGLAGVLTGVGVLLVYAGRFMNSNSRVGSIVAEPNAQRLVRAVPVLSAVVIFVVGLVLTGQALSTAL